MANTLPSFGDISTIECSEGASQHDRCSEETHVSDMPNTESQSLLTDSEPMTMDLQVNGKNLGEETAEQETLEIGSGDLDLELTADESAHIVDDTESAEAEAEISTEDDETGIGDEHDETAELENQATNVETEGPETEASEEDKLFQLPVSRIKRIMQIDPDTQLISKEALAVMAISTENFIAMLAQQSSKLALRSNKKRITLDHFKSTVISCAECDFLEGTLPEYEI